MFRRVLFAALLISSASAFAQVKPGDVAPEPGIEKVLSPSNSAVPTLASLRGKPIVLEFWGTWCGHCIEVLPHLTELHDKFASRGVAFVSVTDEREALVVEFLKTTKMPGIVALDRDGSAFRAFGANALPTTVLIDRSGKVAAVMHPGSITEQTLEDLLADRKLAVAEAPKGETSKVQPMANLVEVSIRPSRMTDRAAGIGANEYHGYGVTALDTILAAFQVEQTELFLETELPNGFYDVTATGPEGSDVAFRMLRSAVPGAFGVEVKGESRPLEVYVVRRWVGHEPKLEKPGGGRRGGGFSKNAAGGTDLSLHYLFGFLNARGKRHVIDETGLTGRYNWSIKTEASDFEGLRSAVREQLGLDLVRTKRTIPVIVVRKKKTG